MAESVSGRAPHAEHALGPSAPGSVVLELGPGTGAIVLHTPPDLDGAEIEISPADTAHNTAGGTPPGCAGDTTHGSAGDTTHAAAGGAPHSAAGDTLHSAAPGRRTHSQVRRRDTAAGAQYAAVYPNVAAGDYTIWHHDDTPALHIRVTGGQVTTARWPDPPD